MAIKKASPAKSKNNVKSKPISKARPRKSDEAPTPSTNGPTIVGIAGSAGALTALQRFFDALPNDSGMAFVVVTHLSPEHESHMAALLQNHTKMPVAQVNHQTPVQANHVYVVPPSKNISVTDSHVDVSEFAAPRSKRTPIDFFFRTLAKSHQDAVAIILSGGGTDGSVGAKEVKEEGGLLMVQDPEEAEYPSMPNAAIATGLVDAVLPVRDLAAMLMKYARQAPAPSGEGEVLDDKASGIIQNILGQVQRRTKHDFSQYKRSTVLRRVRRRMLLNGQPTMEGYLEHIRTHPSESFALLNDLLIGVTNFFRDHEAWTALKKEVIPQIFKKKDPAEPIRVWSVGCASGEEAYSLAILFLEVASELEENRPIQIFASDIDEDSLGRARQGLYPAAIETDVSEERLERFFIREGDHYQVRRELREMVLFTPHSVLRDPPFSRQDVVACRNLLIYLQRDIQQYVLDTFHYSLNPGGYLFLGSSESTAGKEAYFQTLDKQHRIYEALPWRSDQAHVPSMELIVRPFERLRVPGRFLAPRPPSDPLLLEQQHLRSLEAYGPPSILTSGDYHILHVSETAGRYLSQPKGPITNDVLRLVRPELQSGLRTALFQAFEKNRPSISAPIILEMDGALRRVIVSVYPRRAEPAQTGQAAEKRALIVFLEDESAAPTPGTEAEATGPGSALVAGHIAELESERQRLRDQLQIAREEYDNSTEEMKAANEELQSINEEYHLTTEELETSKEELEALNEELQTVNNELKAKLGEISRAHKEVESVMGAMEIATLFLDRGLRIQRFTPALGQFFNILKSDIGRPIDDLRQRLETYGELTGDAQRVLDSLTVLDREIKGSNGEWYVIRLRPYRTVEDKIEGVVITFLDISKQKASERSLEELNNKLEERVKVRTDELREANERLSKTGTLFSMLFHVNPIPTSLTRMEDGKFLDINEAYAAFFGLSREEILNGGVKELKLPFQGRQRADLLARLKREGALRDVEMDLKLQTGESRTVLASLERVTLGESEGILTTFIDITDRVRAERQIRLLAANLTAAEQKERHRIAQILHDDLQQRLFAVKMQISFLQQNFQQGGSEGIREDMENLENWLADAIDTARRLSVDLSPVILKSGSLADSLGWLVEEMRDRYGLLVKVNADGDLPKLDEHLRVLVFESVREILFNVVKHSDILQAEVSMAPRNGNLRIEITDHGKGFDAEAVMNNPKSTHGLLDIRNRLNLLGGSMQVLSQPADGTQVIIEIPV